MMKQRIIIYHPIIFKPAKISGFSVPVMKIVLIAVLLGAVFPVFAQKEVRKELRSGNSDYKKERYTESEIAYRKALEANSRSVEAAYNLGNSLYKQGKQKEALEQYQVVINSDKNKSTLAKTYHNLGNIFMDAKDYAKSVSAYQYALINNPRDNETRYNLAVAQKLLSDQQQQDQNKDQNQDQKDQQDKQDQQKQDQKNQQDKQDKQDQQDQQQNNSNMDKQKAEQILEALSQDEKKTQNKVKEDEARKMKSERKPDKDW